MAIDPSEIEELTRQLVRQPSVTGMKIDPGNGVALYGEAVIAGWIHQWLEGRGVRSILQPLPDGRRNVFAFVRGATARTVVLMGHFDTVPESPGQRLHPPDAGDDGFIHGRGSLHMKSGIAVAMTLMDRWQNSSPVPAVSVLFVATCDEEVESSGVLRAIGLISALKGSPAADPSDGRAAAALTGGTPCEMLGVINVDYTTERYAGDPDRHVWEGTVGKVLAGVYVRGHQTHAGEYFRGFHAMGLLSRLVAGIDGCGDLSGNSPPPVTLKVADAKEGYNVMTSPAGWAYFNVFTTSNPPSQILQTLRKISDRIVGDYIAALDTSHRRYCDLAGIPCSPLRWNVVTKSYSEILRIAVEKAGRSKVEAALAAVRSGGPDARETGFAMIGTLLDLLDDIGPVVVLAFLPPFYPYIAPDRGPFGAAVRSVVDGRRTGDGRAVTLRQFYPFISDMSYLRLEPEIRKGLPGLTDEMPGWGELYSLDLDAIGLIDLPVVNAGPCGFGAHQVDERVEREYSFKTLPSLILDIVAALK